MNNFQASDILHFKKYFFTDTKTYAKHFALILLPSSVMNYKHNLLCSVITSKEEKYYSLKLECNKYQCFSKDCYACFKRRDIEDTDDLSNGNQPIGKLNKTDIKKAFNVIKKVYYEARDIYQMATVIREWKKIK